MLFYRFHYFCFYNNHSLYERPLAKVVKTTIENVVEVKDINGNEDKLYTQHIIAELRKWRE